MKCFLLILLLTAMQEANSQESVGKIENGMLYSVVDINHNGTGFIVSRSLGTGSARQFFLVTNKHMVGEWSPVDSFSLSKDIRFYLYSKDPKNPTIETKVSLINPDGSHNNKLKIHPNTKIDIAAIDITREVEQADKTGNLNLWSIDTSYLIPLAKIPDQAIVGIGDQVFALGYPAGIRSSKTNQPIAKAGYISSAMDGDLEVKFPWKDKKGNLINTSAEGKFFLVDGLIIGGNSGGPVVNPKGRKYRVFNGNIQYTQNEIPNLVFGIVSFGLPGTGISTIYASDHIIDLIKMF